MILTRLRLHDFRTYEDLDISFEPSLTLVLGENATGKTNLVEAIHYLSLARSWRSKEDGMLIRDGASTARIEAEVREGLLIRRLEIELGKNSKKILLNGKPIRRLSELSKVTNVICFSPSDVPLFAGSPGERRSFLDVSLSKRSSDYFSLISRYNRLLKERNAALKSRNPDLVLLDSLAEQLVNLAEPIVRYRSLYVASLNGVLPDLLTRLKGENTPCEVTYRPFVRPDDDFKRKAIKAFLDARESDLIHGSTSVGPHREDIGFKQNGKDIATRGSQGENRMAVLALKLAPSLLVEDEEKKPICVLDDVTSELDRENIKRLLETLKDFGQVFLTATNLDIPEASIVDVSINRATRRN